MTFRYLFAYLAMRATGATHIGAQQHAQQAVHDARRRRIETRGRA